LNVFKQHKNSKIVNYIKIDVERQLKNDKDDIFEIDRSAGPKCARDLRCPAKDTIGITNKNPLYGSNIYCFATSETFDLDRLTRKLYRKLIRFMSVQMRPKQSH